jgi:hypothetical protein
MEIKRREVNLEIRSIDESRREATFVASTERAVPVGSGDPEVLRMSGVKLARYQKNPVLLDSHNRSDLGSVIGKCEVRVEGRKLIAQAMYADTDRAEQAWRLVKGGFVRAVSIGYQVNRHKVRKLRKGDFDGEGDSRIEGPASIVDEWELLEVSNVPIPADEDAIRRGYAEGGKMGSKINYAAIVASMAERDASVDKNSDIENVVDDTDEKTKTKEVVCPHCGEAFDCPASEDTETGNEPVQGDDMKMVDSKKQVTAVEMRQEILKRDHLSICDRIRAVTPKGLESVADEAILRISDESIARGTAFEEAKQIIIQAHAKRFKPIGTPEPESEEVSQTTQLSDESLLRSLEALTD